MENAEKTWRNRGCGGGTASSITVAQANARATTETRLRPTAADEPLPLDRAERVPDLAPVRPAEVDGGRGANERGDHRTRSAPSGSAAAPARAAHAVAALRPTRSVTSLVHLGEALGDRVPRVALDGDGARGGAQPLPQRLVLEQADDPSASAAGSPGGTSRPVSSVMTSLYPSMSDETTGHGARERPRQHHAEALHADRRRRQHLRPQQLAVRSSWLRKPSTSIPVLGDPVAREQQANGERIGADDAEPGTRAAVDLRPGVEQHPQALARVVATDEDDRVVAVCRGPPRAARARRSG